MNGPKTEKIENLFDSIAPDYDKLNHILSLGIDTTWRRRALRWIVDKERKQEILDIACGTGDFSLVIARHANRESQVTGLDLSQGMLDVMKEKVRKACLDKRITTQQGNSESMPFADATFDRVTIAFGIRNFEHRDVALKEILRVLKPGGRLVILELSVPQNKVIRWFYNIYFTKILPIIGGSVSGDKEAYRYLPASVLKFPAPAEWKAFMVECGYRNIVHKAYTLGICRMYCGEK